MSARMAGLACCVLLTGCVMSIAPAISEWDAHYDPALLGVWELSNEEEDEEDEESSPDRVVITRRGERFYVIDYRDQQGKIGSFLGNLGRLGERTVLEVQPAWLEAFDEVGASIVYWGMLLGARLLMVLEIGADTITSAILEVDSVREALGDARLQTSHLDLKSSMAGEKEDRDLLLTGYTDELRAVLPPLLMLPGFLQEEPMVWRRIAP